jgi:hypothetical protein
VDADTIQKVFDVLLSDVIDGEPVALMALGFKERAKEIIGQSETPPANLGTPRPEDLANPDDVVLHASLIVKARGKRGARVYMNDHARVVVAAVMSDSFGRDYSGLNAVNLSVKEINRIAGYLENEAKSAPPQYAGAFNQIAANLRDVVAQHPNQKTFNFQDVSEYLHRKDAPIQSDREKATEQFKAISREEQFHWSQRAVGGMGTIALTGKSWAQSSKGFARYRRALVERGYPDDPEQLAAEIAAKIAAGDWESLGIKTEADLEAARDWLDRYFERVATLHGVEALDNFTNLKQPIREIKEGVKSEFQRKLEERVRAEQEAKGIAGNKSGTARTGSERVQGGATGSGRGSQEGASSSRQEATGSPILPSEAGYRQIRGTQPGIPGLPQRENIRAFGEAPPADTPVGEIPRKQLPLMDVKQRRNWNGVIGDIWHLSKSLIASGDLSASLRQGLFLTLPPTQWHRAARAFGNQVWSLKTKKFALRLTRGVD